VKNLCSSRKNKSFFSLKDKAKGRGNRVCKSHNYYKVN